MSKPICLNCGEESIVLADTHLCPTCHEAFDGSALDKVPLYANGQGGRVIYGYEPDAVLRALRQAHQGLSEQP